MNETTTAESAIGIDAPPMAHEIAQAYEAAIDAHPQDDIPVPDVSNGTVPIEAAPSEGAPSAPIRTVPSEAAPVEKTRTPGNLRLRLKVWTDPQTHKRYLMPSAFMRDVVRGQPVTDVMYAYAMCDDDTKLVTLTASQWNELPFFYFQEDGWAPRANERPPAVIK